MKKFRYRLERVLDVREVQETHEKEKLGRLQRAAAEEAANGARIQAERRRVGEELTRRAASIRPDELRRFDAYLTSLRADLQASEKRQAELARETTRQRERLAKATKAKKTLVKAKERAQDAHRRDLDREEQAGLDEIAGRRAAGGGR